MGRYGNIDGIATLTNNPNAKGTIGKIGTAERPDSARGGDYNLVHLSEVGLWKATEGKKPTEVKPKKK